MSEKNWFIVTNSVIDREDLTIYEKMCLIVLSRYVGKEEFEDLLTSEIIATKMGANIQETKKAIFKLVEKKLINFEGKSSEIIDAISNERIIKKNSSLEKLDIVEFDNLNEFSDLNENNALTEYLESVDKKREKKLAEELDELYEADILKQDSYIEDSSDRNKENKQIDKVANSSKKSKDELHKLIDKVYELLDENISEREARIIISFSDNNFEKIKEKYEFVKSCNYADVIDELIMELQKKEVVKKVKHEINVYPENIENDSEEIKYNKSQVNFANINKLKAYSKFKKK